MKRPTRHTTFALCVRTNGSEDLEQRKLYELLPDSAASQEGYVRVIDESGEDYLYPAEYFVTLSLPPAVVHELKVPANRALQPTAGARRRSGRLRLRAARG